MFIWWEFDLNYVEISTLVMAASEYITTDTKLKRKYL